MITRTFPIWQYAGDMVIFRDIAFPGRPAQLVQFIASDYGPNAAFYGWPLDLDGFTTGPSDYDTPSDEVYCPCGATLDGWDGTAGHLLRLIHHHCETSAHPRPRYEP